MSILEGVNETRWQIIIKPPPEMADPFDAEASYGSIGVKRKDMFGVWVGAYETVSPALWDELVQEEIDGIVLVLKVNAMPLEGGVTSNRVPITIVETYDMGFTNQEFVANRGG